MKNFATVSKIATKSLHPSLRELVSQSRKRPATVDLRFSDSAVEVPSYWGTEMILTLGEKGAVRDSSWVGSDGESNSQAQVSCSGPALHVVMKCGSSPCSLTFFIGNVDTALVESIRNAVSDSRFGTPDERKAALAVVDTLVIAAVEQSLERSSQKNVRAAKPVPAKAPKAPTKVEKKEQDAALLVEAREAIASGDELRVTIVGDKAAKQVGLLNGGWNFGALVDAYRNNGYRPTIRREQSDAYRALAELYDAAQTLAGCSARAFPDERPTVTPPARPSHVDFLEAVGCL